jgi:hypothetical protein
MTRGRQDEYAEGAPHEVERLLDGGEHVAPVERLDEVGQNLRIGFGDEHVPLFDEPAPDLGVILDDAVVHHGDVPFAVEMGMRVHVGRRAVRGPPRVRDAEGQETVGRLFREAALEVADPALLLVGPDGTVPDHRDAGRIVPAVLESFQPADQDGKRLPFTDVAYDAAHFFMAFQMKLEL